METIRQEEGQEGKRWDVTNRVKDERGIYQLESGVSAFERRAWEILRSALNKISQSMEPWFKARVLTSAAQLPQW